MKFPIKLSHRITFVLALLFTAFSVAAQPATNAAQKVEPSSFAGKYEGTVKEGTAEIKLTLDIVEAGGKFSGTLTAPNGSFKILKGQVADGVLILEIEKPGGGSAPMTFKQNGANLTATFSEAGNNLTVEFKRIVTDEISGEWDAIADASGQPFPFALSLKVEGEKVTGSSASQLGNSNISEGSWKDGKLAVILDGSSGKIALTATMIDGKLSGDYDFAGQLQGKWVAIRKK